MAKCRTFRFNGCESEQTVNMLMILQMLQLDEQEEPVPGVQPKLCCLNENMKAEQICKTWFLHPEHVARTRRVKAWSCTSEILLL